MRSMNDRGYQWKWVSIARTVMHLARVPLHAESERKLDKLNLSQLEFDVNLKLGQVADISASYGPDLRCSPLGRRTCA
jgi:hypothetical protein